MNAPGVKTLSRLDARVPKWGDAALVTRKCPFCASDGTEQFARPDGLHVRNCDRCGAFFVSPAPTEEQLTRFYAEYHKVHHRHVHSPREIRAHARTCDVRVAAIASMMRLSGKRILDVGFGQGENMVRFRNHGAAVSGVDLDPYAVETAARNLGFTDVRQGGIDAVGGGERFDAITLHDLIEHPSRPMETLSMARDLLRPDGLISLWTPNASPPFSEAEPTLFRVDLEHMQYLTFKTCAHVAEALSLEIAHLEGLGEPCLEAIDRPRRHRPLRQALKRIAKHVPGATYVSRLRQAARAASRFSRAGRYHLFCILRRPP